MSSPVGITPQPRSATPIGSFSRSRKVILVSTRVSASRPSGSSTGSGVTKRAWWCVGSRPNPSISAAYWTTAPRLIPPLSRKLTIPIDADAVDEGHLVDVALVDVAEVEGIVRPVDVAREERMAGAQVARAVHRDVAEPIGRRLEVLRIESFVDLGEARPSPGQDQHRITKSRIRFRFMGLSRGLVGFLVARRRAISGPFRFSVSGLKSQTLPSMDR